MKALCRVVLAVLIVGCAKSPQRPSLTAMQAQSAAMQLANEQAAKLYQCQPFRAGRPARVEEGHWVWTAQEAVGHGDLEARVELALDGSTNRVYLNLLDSQNLLFSPVR